MLPPLVDLRVLAGPIGVAVLPDREVQVLQGQYRQVHRSTGGVRRVQIRKVGAEDALRPTVRGDVVRDEDEQVLGGRETQQPYPAGRLGRQVERGVDERA